MKQNQHKSGQAQSQSKKIDECGKPILFIVDECYFEPIFKHNNFCFLVFFET
jgi:hypothetical protein